MIFAYIMAPVIMSRWESEAHVLLLQNSARCTSKDPQFCRAHFEGSINQRSKFAVNLCLSELCSLRSAPRGIMEPSKWAPQSFGPMQCVSHFLLETYLWEPKYPQKSHLKLSYSLFFKVIVVNRCHFRDLYIPWEKYLRKKYFVSR